VVAIAGNTLSGVQRYSPSAQDYTHVQESPSSHNFFGTDNLGRDTWARVLEGTLISLQVGLGVQVIVLAIGLFVGGTAALGGRTLDNIMMRITDLFYAFPDLLAIILLRAALVDRDLPVVGHDASQPWPSHLRRLRVYPVEHLSRSVPGGHSGPSDALLHIPRRRAEGRSRPAGSLARDGPGVEAGRRHFRSVEQPIEVIFGQVCLFA